MQHELDVLVDQLDELLGEPIVDEDDALEVATVAGLAARLGALPEQLAAAVAWRDGDGRDLVHALWEAVDAEPLLEELDACTGGGNTDEEIEEALFDVDDLVAAGIWCGRRDAVRPVSRRAVQIVRSVPDVFAPLADLAVTIVKLPAVAEDLDLYGYWLDVAAAHAT